MRDLAFVGFLMAFLALGLKRPFIFVLAYAYVDIVAPQRLSYWMLNAVPVSLIVFGLAFMGWLIADDKRDTRVSFSTMSWPSSRPMIITSLQSTCRLCPFSA